VLAITAFMVLVGAFVGTFLTSCIERLPFEEDGLFDEDSEPNRWYYRIPMFSLFIAMPLYTQFRSLLPTSRCPACSRRIPYFQRLPIISFVWLQGRCAGCAFKIPGRHVIVEAATGLLFGLFTYRILSSPELFIPTGSFPAITPVIEIALVLLAVLLIVSLFVVATVVDFRFQIIPDEVNLVGLIAGFLLASTRSLWWLGLALHSRFVAGGSLWLSSQEVLDCVAHRPGSLLWALSGFVAGAGVLMLLYWIGTAIARTEAMGGGDVKLAGFIGLFLGPQGVLVALFWSTLLGAACGVFILLAGWGIKEGGFTKFAFGPYICAGTLLTLFFGPSGMIAAYMSINTIAMQSISSLFGGRSNASFPY